MMAIGLVMFLVFAYIIACRNAPPGDAGDNACAGLMLSGMIMMLASGATWLWRVMP